jgi:hypothetical protein
MGNKFAVKTFMFVTGTGAELGMAVRKVIELGKNLKWEDAKKMRKENKGSWTVKE